MKSGRRRFVQWTSGAALARAGGLWPAVAAAQGPPATGTLRVAMSAKASDAVTVSAGTSQMVTTVTGEAVLTGPARRD